MTAQVEPQAVGDYDLRAPDFETVLVKGLTGTIGDADRLIARGSRRDDPWANGFPNFYLYRTILAGDTHLRQRVYDWFIAFSIAFALDKGLRTGDRELAGVCAGQDTYRWMMEQRWEHGESVAEDIGCAPKTYRRFRDAALLRNQTSLREYWLRMQFAMLQVKIAENATAKPAEPARHRDGRGFGDEADELMMVGDGNLRALPKRFMD